MKDSLISKYAPINLKDLESCELFKNIIKTLIEIDNLNIIFLGNSGSGKSTLIKVIINEYYKNISQELININILTINSLKEQGISYYRNEVKTFCQTISAIKNKKKLIILDDIDIINDQSQQVFRNYIDKYKNNVHFIASCINPQKLINSLQSRMYIIKTNSFNDNKLYNILNMICSRENIIIDNNASKFLINISNNSVRILINYLEKFKLLKQNITYNLLEKICTNILLDDFINYTNCCFKNQINEAIKLIFNIYTKGYSVIDILDNYFIFIKLTDILNEEQKYQIIKIICLYITIYYTIHEDKIELTFLTNNIISILHKDVSTIL